MKQNRDTNVPIIGEYPQFGDPAILEQIVPELATDSPRILGQPVPELALAGQAYDIPRGERAAFLGSTAYSPRSLPTRRQEVLSHSDPAIWRQPVAELARRAAEPAIWLQPVAKLNTHTAIGFLRQVVAEIPRGQNPSSEN
jgi:hypothetical protein